MSSCRCPLLCGCCFGLVLLPLLPFVVACVLSCSWSTTSSMTCMCLINVCCCTHSYFVACLSLHTSQYSSEQYGVGETPTFWQQVRSVYSCLAVVCRCDACIQHWCLFLLMLMGVPWFGQHQLLPCSLLCPIGWLSKCTHMCSVTCSVRSQLDGCSQYCHARSDHVHVSGGVLGGTCGEDARQSAVNAV